MQDAVERILEGNFKRGDHSLRITDPVIVLNLDSLTPYEGSFVIYGPEGEYTEAAVTSTRIRMKCPVNGFSGSEISIPYIFDPTGLSDGEVFCGDFRIISNHGEYMIPFEVHINILNTDTSLGDIRNLFHFTNLARTDFNEASALFFSDNFEKILSGNDRESLGTYRILKDGTDKKQCLEEFLISIKKKQPVSFLVEEDDIEIDIISASSPRNITIVRNGWGYSHLDLTTDDQFIVLDRTDIDEGDFAGNTARVSFSVNEDALHDGKNYGIIRIKNAYNYIKVTVCVKKHPVSRKMRDLINAQKHLLLDLMRLYEAYKCKKISLSSWIRQSEEILEKLTEADSENLSYKLMKVQLLITTQRFNEASWMLGTCADIIDHVTSDAIYCYYHYLLSLVGNEDTDRESIIEIVQRAYEKDPGDHRVAWILMYLSDGYISSNERKWKLMKDLSLRGSSSPVIYSECSQILIQNPTLLMSLSDFESRIIRYMARRELLDEKVCEQFVYLFNRQRTHEKKFYPVLKECYRILPSDDTVLAITTLLIDNDIMDREANRWYLEAVNRSLRINKLFEYYLKSLDINEKNDIPKSVLMYYLYDQGNDDVIKAYIYAYVHKNSSTYPELYDSYKPSMITFVTDMGRAGKNNNDLAYLYRNLLTENLLNDEISKGLLSAVFINEIRPKRDNIVSVSVVYEHYDKEFTYAPADGVFYVPIYGNNCHIALTDEPGRRFVSSNEYTIKRLMIPDKISDMISPFIKGSILYDLYKCEHDGTISSITPLNLSAMEELALSKDTDDDFAKEINMRLIRYYFDKDMITELDTKLMHLGTEDILRKDYSEAMGFMVMRGLYEKAYDFILRSQAGLLDTKLIVRLCTRLLDPSVCPVSPDEELMLHLIYRAFSEGKYNEDLLKYLCANFKGTLKEMYDIYIVAREFGLKSTDLPERILRQALITGERFNGIEKVFFNYSQEGFDRRLKMAFLSQAAFDYFVLEKKADPMYVEITEKFIGDHEEIPFVVKLAYAKYYSAYVKEMSEEKAAFLRPLLADIISRGMCFSFFKEYAVRFMLMHRFLDKSIVEYRVSEGNRAYINYIYERDRNDDGEYKKEQMKDMYYGICVKEFVLFFGEKLEYYIVESDGENEKLTESSSLVHNDMNEKSKQSKFGMINDMSIARTLGEESTLNTIMREYFEYEYLLGTVFDDSY